MKIGQTCYIVLNNFKVEPVVIKNIAGNLIAVKLVDSNKAMRLPKHRVFESKELAEASIIRCSNETDYYVKRGNRPPTLH